MVFDSEAFVKKMQEKAKRLRDRIIANKVEITINGKKVTHDYPCVIIDCDVCARIKLVKGHIDKVMGAVDKMVDDLDNMFNDLF